MILGNDSSTGTTVCASGKHKEATRTRRMISRWIPVFERLYPLRILVFPAAQARGWPCSPLLVPRARRGSPPDFTLESNTDRGISIDTRSMLKKAGKRSPQDEEEIIRTARRSGIPRTRIKQAVSVFVPVFERL